MSIAPTFAPADDILTDAASVAAIALGEETNDKFFVDTCEGLPNIEVERDGVEYVVTIPYTIVRIPVPKYRDYPDQLACTALEEVGLKLLAASRATGPVWRDMKAIAAS